MSKFRTTALISMVVFIQGCVGAGFEYQTVHKEKIESINRQWAYSIKKKNTCHAVSKNEEGETYQCSNHKEWGFIYIALGIELPIPYYRYSLQDTYVLKDGGVSEHYADEIKIFGLVCGFIGTGDVIIGPPRCVAN